MIFLFARKWINMAHREANKPSLHSKISGYIAYGIHILQAFLVPIILYYQIVGSCGNIYSISKCQDTYTFVIFPFFLIMEIVAIILLIPFTLIARKQPLYLLMLFPLLLLFVWFYKAGMIPYISLSLIYLFYAGALIARYVRLCFSYR